MKKAFIILLLIPFGSWTQSNTGFEFHASVNHPLATSAFLGGGIGANVLFRDTCIFNLKTGLEVNYFHTWDEQIYAGHGSSRTDLYYKYAVVSIPAFARLTFGNRVKFFLEAGAYLGFCADGRVRYTSASSGSFPGDYSVTTQQNTYNPGFFLIPAAAIGIRFPISERLDLFIKPEFAFVQNLRFSGNQTGAGYGGDYDFNYQYTYLRLCVGLHLKPRAR